MLKKITLTILLLGIFAWSNNLLSQNPSLTWGNSLSAITSTDGPVYLSSIKTDASGNMYAMGTFRGTVDFDPGAGVTSLSSIPGEASIVTAKYDASGALLWVRAININETIPQEPKFDVDPSGNVLICGTFKGTIDLNPNAATANVTSSGQTDILVVKLTANGDYAWGFRVGTTANDMYPCVAVDNSGNVFVSSRVLASVIDLDPTAAVANVTGNSAILAKYSSSGTYIWGKNIGVGFAIEMETDAAGDVFLTGEFNTTVDVDPSSSTANLVPTGTSSDVYISKYSAAGNYIWAKSFAGSNADHARSITLDPQGNILVALKFQGTLDLDPSAAVANVSASNGSNQDIAFAKYDGLGDYLWGGSIEGNSLVNDDIYSIQTDAASNVYITGKYDGTADFDITSGVHNMTSNNGSKSFWAKYTPSGNLIWHNEINGSGLFRMTVNALGTEIILIGYFNSILDLDYSAGFYYVYGASSAVSGFIAKYAGNCTATTSSLSITACSSYSVPSGDETHLASGTYMDTISNAAGCDSIITINLTIGDAIAPVANTANLADVTAQCSVTTLTPPTATDNCAGTITGTHSTTLPITAQGTTTVTWTYNDGNGNTSIQTQDVVIEDNTAPVANVANLSNITSECAVTSLTAPTATDNCAGSITGTHNATLPITTQGTTTVTWTYNDGNGNTSTQTQDVVIEDNTAPVANVANLSNITSECEVTSLTVPTATDNCAGSITGTHNASLPITAQGTTTVTWTYNDENGNTTTQTQNVIIDDNTAPVATIANLANVTSECSVASLTAPTATDNCTGSITGTHNAVLPITTQGTTTVTWTYDDGNGNTSTQTQDIVIEDITAPVATIANLANVTSECSVTSLTAPTATDNCAGSITGTHNISLPITAQGTTTVTWTYDDGNGNTSTQMQDIVIEDITAPVATIANLANVTSECSVTSLTAPTATDNCAGSVTGTHNAILPITTSTTTTWTYDDGNGNISTQTQNVLITPINSGMTQTGTLILSANATGYDYQWVDCNNGNQAINGETNQTFTATANGSYAVEIDNGSCTVTSTCITINNVGIESLNQNNWKVYPNPANEHLIIELEENTNILILDVFGKIVLSENLKEGNNTIDVSALTSGVYFIQDQSGATIRFAKK